MKTLYILTFGCQMNVYDSERIADLLHLSHGLTQVEHPEDADVLLMISCSVREKPQEKVFSELGRWIKLNPDRKRIIGVGGCVASQAGEAILKRAPYVNIVFGPQTLHRLPDMIEAIQTGKRKHCIDIGFPEAEKFDSLPARRTTQPAAFVSIMEGCSKRCTYCIVPLTRGKEFSRPLSAVLTEVKELRDQGVKEIHLLGQNVNDYRGKTDTEKTCSLDALILQIADLTGIERIRFTTSHPKTFSDKLIAVFAATPKLVNHLHLPVQSGSNQILSAMHRYYTREDYLEKIARLRQLRPDISLSTDIIVGFPNESEADFIDTLSLVEAAQFDHSFSFIYSKRPGTPAASLPDNVPMQEKKRRLAELQKKLHHYETMYAEKMVGQTVPVLVDGLSKKDSAELCGKTENNRIVNFPGDSAAIGAILPVRITAAYANSLKGEKAIQ